MIHIDDAQILDILPYTMKGKYAPLSLALWRMRAYVNGYIGNMRLWADIDNAPSAALDAMAAEVDAPFYSSDMTDERKRAVIKATYKYNSTVGTVSSMVELLAAAFGGGSVREWYDYGGDPYHFRLDIANTQGESITADGFDLIEKLLDKVKPARAQLDALGVICTDDKPLYIGVGQHGYSYGKTEVTAQPYELTYLTDEDGAYLTDESGNRLIEDE